MSDFQGVGLELGDSGPCPKIVHKDKTWLLGHPTQRAKAELELLVIEQAKRNLEAVRPVLSAAEYRAEENELRMAIRGGHHKTWGPLWVAINNGPDTNTLFLTSLLRERQLEAKVEDAERLWDECAEEVKDALALVVPSFYAILVQKLPGTPEQRAKILAASVAEFLSKMRAVDSIMAGENLPTPNCNGDSSAATTSSSSSPGA